MEMQHLLN